jgi:hypothetical protein
MEQTLTSVSGSNVIDINGLPPQPNQINPEGYYFVDWSKLTNIQDLILILASVGFNFSPSHPQFDKIVHLLDTNNPVLLNSNPNE